MKVSEDASPLPAISYRRASLLSLAVLNVLTNGGIVRRSYTASLHLFLAYRSSAGRSGKIIRNGQRVLNRTTSFTD
jgi:hypothetical protein